MRDYRCFCKMLFKHWKWLGMGWLSFERDVTTNQLQKNRNFYQIYGEK